MPRLKKITGANNSRKAIIQQQVPLEATRHSTLTALRMSKQ